MFFFLMYHRCCVFVYLVCDGNFHAAEQIAPKGDNKILFTKKCTANDICSDQQLCKFDEVLNIVCHL